MPVATAPQTTSPETSVAEEASREVREALEKDPQVQLAKKVAEDLEGVELDKPAETSTETNEYEEAKNRIAKTLGERNKVFKERQAAKQEAEAIRAEAIRIKSEAEAFAHTVRTQYDAISRWQQALRHDPASALRMAGLNPEEFILDLAREGTPEGAAAKQQRELNQKLKQIEDWKKEQEEAREKQRQEAYEAERNAFRAKVESDFVSKANSYSNVSKALEYGLIPKSALIAEGDRIADMYREATGDEASLEDLLEYLDNQISAAIGKFTGPAKPTVPDTRAKTSQKTGQSPAGRSLSLDDAGERRALSRETVTADEDERREAARQAVRAVMERSKQK